MFILTVNFDKGSSQAISIMYTDSTMDTNEFSTPKNFCRAQLLSQPPLPLGTRVGQA